MLSFILLGLALFVYNWGVLAYKGVIGKVGVALSFVLRVRLGRECTVVGGCQIFWGFDSGIRGLFMVVCLFDGVAASCQVSRP